MNNTLESHKLFPYVAWALVIGFALFTYMLTTRLHENLGSLGKEVDDLEERVNAVEARQAQQN
jgi:hypothetical protein